MSENAVELTNVVKRFGAKVAVDHVSFSVPVGACYGLIGPNGAGKTTTFSMLCGYLYPSEGELRVLGADPHTNGALKRKVGVLPQDAILPPWEKVGALLTFFARLSGLKEPEKEARRALDRVGLAETWNTRAHALSHGMAKRVALAQAILGDPPVVMLDEPTAGLDPKIGYQIRQVIREMKGKQTVIVSSHNLNELEELCDAAAILDHGKVVQTGTMAELTAQSEEFRVSVARGEIPLPAVQSIAGVQSASLENATTLIIRFDVKAASAEEMVTRVIKTLIDGGLLISTVSRGRKLEDRVMQLT